MTALAYGEVRVLPASKASGRKGDSRGFEVVREAQILQFPADRVRRVLVASEVVPVPVAVAPRIRPQVELAGPDSIRAESVARWRWTDRGIAVLLGFWAALFLAAVVTVVLAFLAVPEVPVSAGGAVPATGATFGYSATK